LINRFKRFNPPKKLVGSLKNLNSHRIKIVHQEFSILIEKLKKSKHFLEERGLEISKASTYSKKCFEQLTNFLENLKSS
jgi:hypothetical protein